MPITKYQYTISTDFPNAKVNVEQLDNEITANPAITILTEHIDANIEPDKCDIYMADVLPPADEAALDATVAAHQGVGYAVWYPGTLTAVSQALDVTDDLTWFLLYELQTTPRAFDPVVANLFARIIGMYRGGGEIKLVEAMDGQPDEDKLPPYALPDVGAVWTPFKVDSSVPPRDGLRNIYSFCGRRNGNPSFEIRFTTLTMVDAIPVDV